MGAPAEQLTVRESMSLWEIDVELQSLMELAQLEEEETGAVTPATFAALQVYFEAAVTKVDRIAGFLKLEKVLEPAYKEEKRRLEQRWTAYQNCFDRCKQMMLDFLRARNEKQIKGQTNTIARQANGQASLVIEGATERYRGSVIEAAVIPQAFQRVSLTIRVELWDYIMARYKESRDSLIEVSRFFDGLTDLTPTPYVDEAAVRKALQAGKEVEGAELKVGEHIRVR